MKPTSRLQMWMGISLFYLVPQVVFAAIETRLPKQPITISGRVIAPSCQAKLETDTVTLTAVQQDGKRAPQEAGQHLALSLSECDFDGIGIAFYAETVAGHPERGVLRRTCDHRIQPEAYYTLGFGDGQNNHSALYSSLSMDSALMEKGQTGARYFSLNRETYWLDVTASLSRDEKLRIPLIVEAHAKSSDIDDDLAGHFAVQLSWR